MPRVIILHSHPDTRQTLCVQFQQAGIEFAESDQTTAAQLLTDLQSYGNDKQVVLAEHVPGASRVAFDLATAKMLVANHILYVVVTTLSPQYRDPNDFIFANAQDVFLGPFGRNGLSTIAQRVSQLLA